MNENRRAMAELMSPKIIFGEWGKIEAEGGGIYKDVKCFPGGSREWNWNETQYTVSKIWF